MPESVTFGSIAAPRPAASTPEAETPFRIAFLGNLGGAPRPPLAGRRPVKVGHDSFDAVLAKVRPALRLSAAGERVELTFSSLDDFHPDQIAEKMDFFADLGEDEKTEVMRAVLHHRDFQPLETTWRGLEWLLRRADRGGHVEVLLYDVTREELAADLGASEDLSRSGLYRLLVEDATQGQKGGSWGLFVGAYLFEQSPADARTLGRLAKVAGHAGAPFVAGAAPSVWAPADAPPAAAAAWAALRQLPEAAMLGLVAPRFLLRPPYGPDTASVEQFHFEELDRDAAAKPYLWGSGGLACAALIAQGFQKQGWAFRPGASLDLPDMPMHVVKDEDGDPVAVLAEAWADRRLAESLGRRGVMCLLGVRGVNALQLTRFQSLAQPAKDKASADLWGPWGQEGVAAPAATLPSLSVNVGFGAPAGGAPAVAAPRPAAPAQPAPAAAPESPPAAEADEAAEQELDALLKEFEEPAPAAADGAPPAEDADADLDALLKELGGDAG